ncbi:MAG: hypothetical protein SGI71_06830 [Verrucomicrobiota bacterium]|nr:hypothetical protein [Verrucomicrobiota bacterium]
MLFRILTFVLGCFLLASPFVYGEIKPTPPSLEHVKEVEEVARDHKKKAKAPKKTYEDPQYRAAYAFKIAAVKHLYLDRNISPGSVDLHAKYQYQDTLSKNPDQVYGKRFAIHWKGSADHDIPELIVRLELRGLKGNAPTKKTIDFTYRNWVVGSRWTEFDLVGDEYKEFGQLTAWHATVIADGQVVARKKSILWE